MRFPFRFSWPLALTVLAWALNYVAVKGVYQVLTPSQLAFLRYLVMYAALVVLCLINRESLKLPKKDALPVLWFGACSMAIYMFLFLEGMRWIDAAEGSILLSISPVVTMLLAAAMRVEKLRAGGLLGAFIGFAGIVLVTIPTISHAHQTVTGVILLLAGACTWAYCIVIMKPLLRDYSPLRLMTLSMPGGFVFMLAYWLARDHGAMPLAQVPPIGWLEFLHIALLSGVMGFILFYRGVHEIGSASAALWMYFVPPLTAVCQWILLGKMLTPLQFGGLVVVLLGVATAQHFRGLAELPAAPVEPA